MAVVVGGACRGGVVVSPVVAGGPGMRDQGSGMSRKVGAKSVARQDQILAILRDAEGFPMSTSDIAAKMGTKEYTLTRWCKSCGLTHDCMTMTLQIAADDVRPQLVRLERDGRVERIIPEASRYHYWRSS